MNFTQALSTERLQQLAPSAFATIPYSAMSNRYAFIPTSEVIEGMRQAGFFPVQASQSRTRIADKRDFTKHMIRFRSAASLTQTAVVGEHIMEAVLINSHDGTSRYKLMCGVYRFVCANGMVVADSMLESINVKHMGDVVEQVVSGTQKIFDQGPRVMDTIGEWERLELNPAEQQVFAGAAHSLRFPVDDEGKAHTQITPQMLLSARRREDIKPDLWHTFNRVQENTTKKMRAVAPDRRSYVSSRAVKGIDGDVKLNRALWTLAEKMAEIKAAA